MQYLLHFLLVKRNLLLRLGCNYGSMAEGWNRAFGVHSASSGALFEIQET